MILLVCPTCSTRIKTAVAGITVDIRAAVGFVTSRRGQVALGLQQPVSINYMQLMENKPKLDVLTCTACGMQTQTAAWMVAILCDNCQSTMETVEVSKHNINKWLCKESHLLYCNTCWGLIYKRSSSFCSVCQVREDCKERRQE